MRGHHLQAALVLEQCPALRSAPQQGLMSRGLTCQRGYAGAVAAVAGVQEAAVLLALQAQLLAEGSNTLQVE